MTVPARPSTTPPTGHRERLLEGMAAAIREHGYRDSKITDVVAHARTSRRSFYEQFEDREACYLALVDEVEQALVAAVEDSVDPSAPWEQQVDQALGTYLDAVASEPELMISATRELPALGAVGAERQRIAIERFAGLLTRVVNTDDMRRSGLAPISEATAVLLVGGMRELVARTLERGESLDEVRAAASAAFKSVLATGGVASRASA